VYIMALGVVVGCALIELFPSIFIDPIASLPLSCLQP